MLCTAPICRNLKFYFMRTKLKYLSLVHFLHREVQVIQDFPADVHALLFLKWEHGKDFVVEVRGVYYTSVVQKINICCVTQSEKKTSAQLSHAFTESFVVWFSSFL